MDGKADNKLFKEVLALARRFGREDDVLHLNLLVASGSKDSNTFNPFAVGNADAIREMVVSQLGEQSAGNDSNGVFRSRAVALIGTVVPVLTWIRDHENIAIDIEKIRDALELRVIWKLAHRVPFASTEPGMINTPFTPMLESAIEGTPGPSNEAGRPANPIDATLVAGVTAVETAIGASKQTARAKALDLLARRDEVLHSLEKSKPPELSADELRQEIHRLINELRPGAEIERAVPMATQSEGMAP